MTARILIVDDLERNARLLREQLAPQGYETAIVLSGAAALDNINEAPPDLVLLDVMMPGMDGYAVCRAIRERPLGAMLPIVLVTALDPRAERIRGLEAGADDFLSKPVQTAELVARVRSLLRIKQLYDQVENQKAQLAQWNRTLEHRVAEGIAALERMSLLKRFFSPQLAQAILEGGAADPLPSHRRDIAVVFLDLRGYTAFTQAAPPEAVMQMLSEYHHAMGLLIGQFDGTLERFSGDAIMVFFNDPRPMPDYEQRAVAMAVAMQAEFTRLAERWATRGFALELGIGMASGPATIGAIGFEGRIDYGAIGPVTNLAARLCDAATGGEILADARIAQAANGPWHSEPAGRYPLKGLAEPQLAYRISATPAP